MIPVTKPFLPPIEEYKELIDGVWERQWLTNMGPLAVELENTLKEYLNLDNVLFVTNGTIAIQMAIKALDLTGEIITTPFSYVATTSSIFWEGCTPVFVDIDRDSLNIDATLIEAAITDKTTAILATHVYGNPCDVEMIAAIAEKHNLKVIYDAAHAFGVNINGKSLFYHGDISTCSLHATKLFHSGEGGLVFANDKTLIDKIAYTRNFGHNGPENFQGLGINGKNSEFHAAMGLVNFKHIDYILSKRAAVAERYNNNLETLNARRPVWHPDSKPNNSYYPLVFDTEKQLLETIEALKKEDIFGRRYFYPSLAKSLPYIPTERLDITEDIASRVFCFPLYTELTLEDVDLICSIVLKTQND
ncbi:DegT/DnrJ/EryC1/StrS family aminotransferase [Ulvibacter litoralis]|uniref:dTDP-4-amino-4,6-dideoxygalactose transaminase n=1 Tax=Ulvibacter litoralis TaxID=227084 RepID=A0A1G7HME0_9FLAO|nr:DegT/DnrJ/EryC1/StrS family aminotransferase [Ulvibacter litoralis]GHC58376.1 aminotransferase DegT [Ulvibacter litoralis]SDF01625.1 dTDP-4-amino-4,6-dideoxygalactose transaminase [Ulvibacter litoralis]